MWLVIKVMYVWLETHLWCVFSLPFSLQRTSRNVTEPTTSTKERCQLNNCVIKDPSSSKKLVDLALAHINSIRRYHRSSSSNVSGGAGIDAALRVMAMIDGCKSLRLIMYRQGRVLEREQFAIGQMHSCKCRPLQLGWKIRVLVACLCCKRTLCQSVNINYICHHYLTYHYLSWCHSKNNFNASKWNSPLSPHFFLSLDPTPLLPVLTMSDLLVSMLVFDLQWSLLVLHVGWSRGIVTS